MEAYQKIIAECVDFALSQVDFIDKKEFYKRFQASSGIKWEEIGANFDAFHTFLSSRLGIQHYQIERLILRTMKERTQDGIYRQTDEITSFSIVTDAFLRESEANVERIKQLTSLEKYTKNLEQVVKEADDRLKASERLSAIGETAAMVGHDIRNPLQSIAGELYLLAEGLKEVQEGENKLGMQESLSSIQENISYINKIVADLQDYARPLTPEWKRVDISKFLVDFIATVEIPERIRLELEIDKNLNSTTDSMFLRRALTNLVNNAVQAMPREGTLSIAAYNKSDRICLTVSDTGEGIPDEVRQRIFKPLITTKSKGQGLGLAVVKRLVEALNGSIDFESEKGKGTKFIIDLPLLKTPG